jgi:hypothetical protein
MPDVLSPPRAATNPGADSGDGDGAAGSVRTPDSPTGAEHDRNRGMTVVRSEPPLPNGAKRTYLTSGGSAAVAVVFLAFLAILLAYFSSATLWAPW